MEIRKIVLSGGPCAGKTAALSLIKKELEAFGVRVLTISETASDMMSGGVAPWTCGTFADFQMLRLELQLERESVFERAAATMEKDRVLIVCDRAALDSKTYMTPEVFSKALRRAGKSEAELRDSYDAVFHLETAAKGAAQHYEKVGLRRENSQEAISLDDKLISAWCGNPHLRIIPAMDDFDEKMRRLVEEVKAFCGIPEPFETERKFLIEYPDLRRLDGDPLCK
ncbi:MAG: ATP-binding protein, partial [Clostridia bacterium]|nr:ATP-binding protein [Clostridia bacterium]